MSGKDVESGEAFTGESKILGLPERLKLLTGDHPGMSLVSAPLDGKNYLSWSRSIKLALGAKQKLGFIDGTGQRVTKNKDEIEQWERVDCMVFSWLLNSLSKEIAEAFLYATSTQDFWQELESRFGDSNGPMLYEFQREITSLSQGDMSISAYTLNSRNYGTNWLILLHYPSVLVEPVKHWQM
ncbi:hypothetical protein Sango_2485800 [Sesamum angolense]|uniref:Retrotransposon Copia-like N-terminal domain-containing protein n=1 Tax=Sesamum angolense TaxID=2727404 RepID=A0AAE1W3P3_9LAMI|nr:hypothetical protein Sango_2485800 [Sesamum angolense]